MRAILVEAQLLDMATTTDRIILTVDCLVRLPGTGEIVLIDRAKPPLGLALPGGKIEPGETAEEAVVREIAEEVGLDGVCNLRQFKTYTRPDRDPRPGRWVSIAFTADAPAGVLPKAGSDAAGLVLVHPRDIDWSRLAFDHAEILRDGLAFLGHPGELVHRP